MATQNTDDELIREVLKYVTGEQSSTEEQDSPEKEIITEAERILFGR